MTISNLFNSFSSREIEPERKPTLDEEVKSAIVNLLKPEYMRFYNQDGKESMLLIPEAVDVKTRQIAIKALRHYVKDPCLECKKYEKDFYYCPDCGRKNEVT